MPKLSVITPTYNRANMLIETINSILSQTYKDFEYIIVDDGSTDNTKEIVGKYNDPRIKYYRHDNIGEAKTVNRGYKLSSGEYTIIVNSDDPLYDKNYFHSAIRAFESDPEILAVYPDWIKIDENSNEIDKIYDKQHDLLSMSLDSSLMIGPGMMIKRKALEQIGFRDESIKYTGDLSISFDLVKMGRIKHLEIFGATHRYHSGCLQNTAPQIDIGRELLILFLKIFKKNRCDIPVEILANKREILKNALHIYKAYAQEPLKIMALLDYKSLFNNPFEFVKLLFHLKKRKLIQI